MFYLIFAMNFRTYPYIEKSYSKFRLYFYISNQTYFILKSNENQNEMIRYIFFYILYFYIDRS